MEKNNLTIADALKFARHDFLNELQLVLMHIDLGNISEAKQTIFLATEEIRQLSMLHKLRLPAIEQWINTFDWEYKAFRRTITCTINPGIREVDDLAVVKYLQSVFDAIMEILDETAEYEIHFNVEASSYHWTITITISGSLKNKFSLPTTDGSFSVNQKFTNNLWTFTISGR